MTSPEADSTLTVLVAVYLSFHDSYIIAVHREMLLCNFLFLRGFSHISKDRKETASSTSKQLSYNIRRQNRLKNCLEMNFC